MAGTNSDRDPVVDACISPETRTLRVLAHVTTASGRLVLARDRLTGAALVGDTTAARQLAGLLRTGGAPRSAAATG
jgi:NAD(P)H-nitrite reductase large subunit